MSQNHTIQSLIDTLSLHSSEGPNGAIVSLEDAVRALHAAASLKFQALQLTNDGAPSPYTLSVEGPSETSRYNEISVLIRDQDGAACADLIVGVNPDSELRVAITSDGAGDGDKNIIVFPMRPAEDAVEVDVHNSQLSRKDRQAG